MIWGPVALTTYTILAAILGALMFWGAAKFDRRAREAYEAHRRHLSESVVETLRLLDQDRRSVNVFMDAFGRDLVDAFGAAVKDMTLHDMRTHIEIAVFDLVQGCRCGECSGVSDCGMFRIEASYFEKGLRLRGVISRESIVSEVACTPRRDVHFQHSEKDMTMICVRCKAEPVVITIESIGQGKHPVCDGCMEKASATNKI